MPLVLEIAAFIAAGLLLGAGYFALLRRAVAGQAAGRPALSLAALHGARLALAVAAFWLVAQLGAAPLLSAALGFMLARILAVRLTEMRSC